jgi:hypothetical protein
MCVALDLATESTEQVETCVAFNLAPDSSEQVNTCLLHWAWRLTHACCIGFAKVL